MRFSIISLLFPFTVNALSATTANTIIGTAPYLLLSDGETKLTDLNQLLGFSMPNRDGTSGREQFTFADKGTTFIAPNGMKLSDVYTLSSATVGDLDGDADGGNGTVTATIMKAEWKVGGKVTSNLNQTLSQCGGPYELTITVDGVAASTTYGKPNKTEYKKGDGTTSETVTYNFTGKDIGICNLKPLFMQVVASGDATMQKFPATGYNPDAWEANKGFKRSSGFPTTGFNKARFDLIGPGTNQKLYRCNLDSGNAVNWVTLSGTSSTTLGQNCTATYNTVNRPLTPLTINMEYSADGSTNWVQIDSYTLDYSNTVKTLWAKPTSSYYFYGNTNNLSTSTLFPAASICKDGTTSSVTLLAEAKTYFYSRAEFTNNPYANPVNYPELHADPSKIGGRVSRDVDTTFMGEWGMLGSYGSWGPNGGWGFWTSESFSLVEQFYIIQDGSVDKSNPTSSAGFGVGCRG